MRTILRNFYYKIKLSIRVKRKFFELRNKWSELPWHEQIPLYLEELSIIASYQDWQVRQAEQAVRVYFNNFCQGQPDSIVCQSPQRGRTELASATGSDMREEFIKALMLRHYSTQTVKTYRGWLDRFLRYCKTTRQKPFISKDSGHRAVRDFLAYLAIKEKVSASTQNQALNSLLTFFRLVFNIEFGDLKEGVRARTGTKLPSVFSVNETKRVLQHVKGVPGLALKLIYGSGLRVIECCRLRIQDLDFNQQLVMVRQGKGNKDRTTVLPQSLFPALQEQQRKVSELHDSDLNNGFGSVWLPPALARKYPAASKEKGWQYLFPSAVLAQDPEDGSVRRHHISSSTLQRAIKIAVKRAQIQKHASVHTLRHSFATHLLLAGVDIRQIQEYLGHARVETTMIYTHVIKDLRNPVASPLDQLINLSSTEPADAQHLSRKPGKV